MKTPTIPQGKPPADPPKPGAAPASGVSAAALAASGGAPVAPAPGLPADDPLRDPAVPAGRVAPTLDPAAPDPVPARELPGEVINAAAGNRLADRAMPSASLDIGAQAPGRDATSGSTDGVAGRGTLIETDRTEPETMRLAAFRSGDEPMVLAEVAGPAMLVSCAHNRRRAGFAFGPTPVRLPLDRLDETQIDAIEADPLLTIRRA